MDFWFALLVAWFLHCLWYFADSSYAFTSYCLIPRASWRNKPTPEQLVEFTPEFQMSGTLGTLVVLLHMIGVSFAGLAGVAHHEHAKGFVPIYLMVSILNMLISSKISRWCAKRLKERSPERSS
ncbi:hypothetical protein KBA73_01675 [Patescibacteria group bacterium]|nr:hypothetical protein [Patescibacteria group bacterium]